MKVTREDMIRLIRNTPPSLLHDAFQTEFPDDFQEKNSSVTYEDGKYVIKTKLSLPKDIVIDVPIKE